MTWDEPWRREQRPDASEIPDDYGIWPEGRGQLIAAYFVGLFVAYYIALELFGGQAILIAGYPLLMWLAGLLIAFTLLGMYALVWRTEVRARETETETETGTGAEAETTSAEATD